MGDLVLGNFLTLVTEFIGVRAGLGFFGVRPAVAVGGALVIVVGAITTRRYWMWGTDHRRPRYFQRPLCSGAQFWRAQTGLQSVMRC